MQIEWGYALTLIGASIISIALAHTAWRRGDSPGSRPLAVLMISLALWSLPYAMHWLRLPEPRPLFWVDLTYLGVVSTPVMFILFTLQFTGRDAWLKPARIGLLFVIPVLTLILLWTDPQHGLFFGDVIRSADQALIFAGGFWFYVHVIYSYGLILHSMSLFTRAILKAKDLYRQQIIAMLTGALIPVAINVMVFFGYVPFPGLDLTPLAFTVTGLFFAIALYRLGLLDIIPVARESVVDEMSDGMLVLDTQNRILDINPAARKLLEIGDRTAIGKHSAEVLAHWSTTIERFRETLTTQEEMLLPNGITIDLRITPLYGWGNSFRGRLIILRDISDRIQIEAKLRDLNYKLQGQLSENEALQSKLMEQAIRDPLTGLFNRRYLEESLSREISQRGRDRRPLSVGMLDIDKFKVLNDTYGHAVGDRMLQSLAQILREHTRGGDIVCRFGGEEFVVVMPGADKNTALLRLDYVRQTFENLQLDHNGEALSSTISAGVASHLEDGITRDELLEAADQAMYLAKERGRNLVTALDGL